MQIARVNLTEGRHPPNSQSVATHLVFVPVGEAEKLRVRCAGASDAQISALTGAVAAWRDLESRRMHMQQVGTAIGLSGLVYIFDTKRDPFNESHVLPPIPEPFEPVELREGVAQLHEILDQTAASASVESTARASGRLRRLVIRSGLTAFVVIQLLFNGFNFFRLWGWKSLATWGVPAFAALVVVIFGVRRRNEGQWHLVPGGVVYYAAGLWSRRRTLYTPADCIMILEPAQNAWHATIIRSDGTIVKRLTRMEMVGLIAAWQSPVAPPSDAQLRRWFDAGKKTRGTKPIEHQNDSDK